MFGAHGSGDRSEAVAPEQCGQLALDAGDQRRAFIDQRRVELDQRRAGANTLVGIGAARDPADADERPEFPN